MDDKILDKVTDLLNDWTYGFDCKYRYDIETQQPKHCSWVSIDAGLEKYSTDASYSIEYENSSEMKVALVRLIDAAFSEDLLELVRTGEIVNLNLRIGPHAISGFDYNNENGIEEFAYSDRDEKVVK